MFDRVYFETRLHEQRQPHDGSAWLEITLHSGHRYLVHSIQGIFDGTLLLEVYGENTPTRERIAVAYESIANVLSTRNDPNPKQITGFAQV